MWNVFNFLQCISLLLRTHFIRLALFTTSRLSFEPALINIIFLYIFKKEISEIREQKQNKSEKESET